MFIAHDRNGKMVSLLQGDLDASKEYFCPVCKGHLVRKKGVVVREHFAHKSLETCSFTWENESPEHLRAKGLLFTWARLSGLVEVEHHFSEIQQVADLYLSPKLVLEVQCSSLSAQRLRERSFAYHSIGKQVLWLLGKKLWLGNRLTSLQKDFLYFSQSLGFYLWEIDVEKLCLRLKYLIHQDLHGKAQYKIKEFSFDEGNILDVFRFPYQKRAVQSFLAQLDVHLMSYIRRQLYYKEKTWLTLQECLYKRGENILQKQLDDFYPQVKPIVSSNGFCQIVEDLTPYYQAFEHYYQQNSNKKIQIVYSPAFYRRLSNKY